MHVIGGNGPPEGWTGGHVPVRLEAARTPTTLVHLDCIEAFPTGVAFQVRILTREGFGMHDVEVEVATADGTVRTDDDLDPYGTAPMVLCAGGHGSGEEERHEYWLSPLPPAGTVRFTVEVPALSIRSGAELDGQLLVAAAEAAEQLWEPLTDEEHEERGRAIRSMIERREL